MKYLNRNKKGITRSLAMFSIALLATVPAMAQTANAPSSVSNPFVLLLVIIACVLAVVIGFLARMVIGSAGLFIEKAKAEVKENKGAAVKAALVAGLILLGSNLMAQPAAADSTKAAQKTASASLSSVSDTAYYMLAGVVFTELLLVVVLLYMLRVFVLVRKKAAVVATGTAEAAVAVKKQANWWDKFNKIKPIHEEADIDLGHNYDGIRELDNRLPPWWLYGFYITIIFAAGYLYMHHISHSLPSNIEQYQAQVAEGEAQKSAYLKQAANNVDETSVTLLTDAASIDAGKQIFTANCFACHGKLGEGGVGPNLTDNYWLHGGSIKEVFKTIKYGWPDKGMKSWKDDFSPVQIQQIASYVKSLQGTNPPNGKAPQGVLADSTATVKDTTAAVKDTTVAAAKK